jgi:4-hydroxybenzoate polyprenyltransferase
MLHHLLTLARVSNLPTVWSNCLAAWLISGAEPSWRMIWLLAGASLLYAAGCTLNDAFDVKWDAQHRPERLIPSGQLSRGAVWGIGLTEMAAGLGLILAGGVSLWWAPPSLAAGILLYDAWHKQSPLSVIVMGACRWLLYLTAAAVAGGNLKPVMVLGGVLWLYIIVLSLVARGEAKRGAGTPKTRHLLLLVPAAAIAAAMANGSEWLQVTAAALICAAGLAGMLKGVSPSPGDWVNRLLAAIPLIDLALYCTVLPRPGPPLMYLWAFAFPGFVVLSLFFQKWFRAT